MDFVTKLDVTRLPGNTLLQGAKFDPVDRVWLLGQAIDTAGPGDIQHTRIHRFSEAGDWQGYVQLQRFGHCTTFGYSMGWLWVPCNEYAANGNMVATRAARVDVSKIDWTKRPVFTAHSGNVQVIDSGLGTYLVPFGPTLSGLYLRWGRADTTEFLKVDQRDFRSIKRPKILAHIVQQKAGLLGSFQGCTTKGGVLSVLNGNTNVVNRISTFGWDDGKPMGHTDITPEQIRSVLKGHVTTLSSVEPEGLGFYEDRMVMGVRTGPAGTRRDFALVSV